MEVTTQTTVMGATAVMEAMAAMPGNKELGYIAIGKHDCYYICMYNLPVTNWYKTIRITPYRWSLRAGPLSVAPDWNLDEGQAI